MYLRKLQMRIDRNRDLRQLALGSKDLEEGLQIREAVHGGSWAKGRASG